METVLDGIDGKANERLLRDLDPDEGQSARRHRPQLHRTTKRQSVMSEKNLKIVPPPAAVPETKAEAKIEAKTRPGEQAAGETPHRARRKRVNRKQLRMILLVAAAGDRNRARRLRSG